MSLGLSAAGCASKDGPATHAGEMPLESHVDDAAEPLLIDTAADGASDDAVADAVPESAVTDAAPESAAADAAPADAFCDATWPTTKGNMPPAACIDPENKCLPKSHPLECQKRIGAYQCESFPIVASTCVKEQWQCPTGTMPANECKCYGEVPAGYVCTATGLRRMDAGAGGAQGGR
jgi:hypothetical protein